MNTRAFAAAKPNGISARARYRNQTPFTKTIMRSTKTREIGSVVDGPALCGKTEDQRRNSEFMNETPDKVCKRYTGRNVQLNVSQIEDYVLVEGDEESLQFLGELFLAQAKQSNRDCGFQISPTGAGKGLFSPNANRGIYIHRIPCKHTT